MSIQDTDRSLEGIAIIGMACRFPGANDIDRFWQNICNAVESISVFSDQELLASGIDPMVLQHPNYVKARPMLDGIDLFDAAFFGISPREAAITDPQHRLFLECAWNALEYAGYCAETYKGLIGVYAGVGECRYLFNLYSHPSLIEKMDSLQLSIGTNSNYLTTRVSYKLNLKGPSVNVQTACSSSLVAVHLACQNLLQYQCDMALAGGLTLDSLQKEGYFYQAGGIVSPDGHCMAFDERAQGTVFGNGGGVVVLKRLEDALEDGDTIYAVIKGSAINNDGATKIGFTAPSVDGQAAAIAEAQALAGIDVETIGYIETHGTGTQLGDPIEIAALKQVFAAHTTRKNFCALGSVKTNIGHLDTAAGVAGLIKTALALKHKTLPPSLHFRHPNPQIDFVNSPFYVNATLSPWKAGEAPRRAGVSAFGVGGTNAHLLLEESPTRSESGPSMSWQLLPLSARTSTALENMTVNFAQHLQQHTEQKLADVAYTLQVGRKRFNHRRILICQSPTDAHALLQERNVKSVLTEYNEVQDRQVAFLFPGQGSQYIHMASDLYREIPIFRELVDYCSQLLQPSLGVDLREVLYPSDAAEHQLEQTAITQPALFVIEYALAKMWMAWGIQPQMMLGHSIGEYVSACLANVFTLEEALQLVAARGRVTQQCQPGAMLAIPLGEDEVRSTLGSLEVPLSLAAINAPSLCVVAGAVDDIHALQQQYLTRGLTCTRLHTSHAFHSEMMDPALATFTRIVQSVTLRVPTIPYVSNVTGTWITPDEATDPYYWAQHLRQTVQFSKGVRTILKDSDAVLLEVGPGQTLRTFVQRQQDLITGRVILSSLPHPKEQQSTMRSVLTALGQLWLVGKTINWENFHAEQRRLRSPLPTYPFERQSYWISPSMTDNERKTEVQASQHIEAIAEFSDVVQTYIRPDIQSTYVAPENEVEQILCNIWQQLLGIEQVGIHDNFFELGGHSLLAIQLMSQIYETYKVGLPIRSLFETSTIKGLAQAVIAGHQRDIQSSLTEEGVETIIDLATEALLDPAIRPESLPDKHLAEPHHIFLTGATGFIGIFLLYELLQQTEAHVHCLIRSINVEEGKKKLREKLESHRLWDERFNTRIIPVPGDLSQPYLGVSPEQFDTLAREIDVIYHNGAWVNFMYPYQVLKSTNVTGTQEILRLACRAKTKPVHHISSTAVFELDDYSDVEVIKENSQPGYRPGPHAGYAQSKWVAEQMVMECRARGLPVTVYRAGNVAGHSQTGACNVTDVLYRAITGCLQIQMVPDVHTVLDITPVDYVSKALVYLSRQSNSVGKVYHLVNPQAVLWHEFVRGMEVVGYQFEHVSYQRWLTGLAEFTKHSPEHTLRLLLFLFTEDMYQEQQTPQEGVSQPVLPRYDCKNAFEGLTGSFILCPSVDAELIGTYLSYLVRTNIVKRP